MLDNNLCCFFSFQTILWNNCCKESGTMSIYQNILYTSRGTSIETGSLKQILLLAQEQQSQISILITFPEFPKKLENYQNTLEKQLKENIEETIKTNAPELINKVEISFESTSKPAVNIIQKAIRNSHDVVLKQAPLHGDESGFDGLDQELLRKCPCPVLLYRKPIHEFQKPVMVVAIDPQSNESSGDELAVNLLKTADSIAQLLKGELVILSCWDYEFQDYLHNNAFIHISENEIMNAVTEAQSKHKDDMNKLIIKAGIKDKYREQHLRGKPEVVIPKYLEDYNVDLLLMGTIARTGISGFFIGNTAENVLHNISCSLLAMKPPGFVSPVKAY